MKSTLTKNRNFILNPAIKTGMSTFLIAGLFSCATLPDSKYEKIKFPKKGATTADKVSYPFKKLGIVRTKILFPTTDPEHEPEQMCLSAFNQGAHDLLSKAKKEFGATAIISVRSVVFYLTGEKKLFETPECSDDSAEGQILMQAEAIQKIVQEKQ